MGNILNKLAPARKDGTATGVAKIRYMELLYPDSNKFLIKDPYAYQFAAGSTLMRWLGFEMCHQLADSMPGLYESILCRTVFLDKHINQGIDNLNVTQVVIMGAGYDNRFYRLESIRNCKKKLTLIEVDQPEVQKKKKNGLKKMGVIDDKNTNCDQNSNLPEDAIESYGFTNLLIDDDLIEKGKLGNIQLSEIKKDPDQFCVQFCPCNFETMNFVDQIKKTDFDSSKKTIFVLEGLSQYVDKSALAKTISDIDALCDAPGSKILMSYVDNRSYDSSKVGEICSDGGASTLDMIETVKKKKEPWVTGFDVDETSKTYELQDWLMKNTNGNFSEDYTDQSWKEFNEKDLTPLGRNVYQFGKKKGNILPTFGVERHVCVTRK